MASPRSIIRAQAGRHHQQQPERAPHCQREDQAVGQVQAHHLEAVREDAAQVIPLRQRLRLVPGGTLQHAEGVAGDEEDTDQEAAEQREGAADQDLLDPVGVLKDEAEPTPEVEATAGGNRSSLHHGTLAQP
jgi:hypothetical protein